MLCLSNFVAANRAYVGEYHVPCVRNTVFMPEVESQSWRPLVKFIVVETFTAEKFQ